MSNNYFNVKIYKGEDILVTPEQALKINPAILRGDAHIEINGQPVKVTNIATVEETNIPIPPGLTALPSGQENKGKRPRMVKVKAPEGVDYDYDPAVETKWCKRYLTKREFAREGANHRKLYEEGGLVCVAFRFIVFEDEDGREWPLPDGYSWVDDPDELRQLLATESD